MTIVISWAMFKWAGIPLFVLAFFSFFYLLSLLTNREPNPIKLTFSLLNICLFVLWLLVIIGHGILT